MHLIRMPSNRHPRRVLYGELVNGQRLPGGPMLAVHGPHPSYPEQVQYLYCRRNWSSFLLTETHCILPTAWQLYNVSADQAAEDRRTRRHNSASQPTNYWSDMPTVQPNLCFRVRPAQPSTESCLTSTSATLLAAQTSSSNSTDYCKQASKP